MNINQIRKIRLISTLAGAGLLAASMQAPASAIQDRGEKVQAAAVTSQNCRLERVGLQYVRCDNLTGAGVAAPRWVPAHPSVGVAYADWRQPGTP